MENIQEISKGSGKRNNRKIKGATMKKNVLLLGSITEKHAKVFDELKASGDIGTVYVVPAAGKNVLMDEFKLNDPDTNKNVSRTMIKEKFIIVKGKTHTENFIRPIIELNKFLGGGRLIHCCLFKNKETNQIFVLTDGACNLTLLDEVNVVDLVGKAIQYATEVYCKCAWESQEIYASLLSAGGENNPATNQAYYDWWVAHKSEYPEGQLRIEQLDVALNREVREGKGIEGPVSQIVVVRNINEGNAIWKSLTALNKDWIVGGLLMGSPVPIVLNSREDTAESLTYAIKCALKI